MYRALFTSYRRDKPGEPPGNLSTAQSRLRCCEKQHTGTGPSCPGSHRVHTLIFVCTFTSWLMCDMTHSRPWHDSFRTVTWLARLARARIECTRWCTHKSWVICDMTHSWPRYDSSITETCQINPNESCHIKPKSCVAYACVRKTAYWPRFVWARIECTRWCSYVHLHHDSCVTWLIHGRDVTRLEQWHDSFTAVTWHIAHAHVRVRTYIVCVCVWVCVCVCACVCVRARARARAYVC